MYPLRSECSAFNSLPLSSRRVLKSARCNSDGRIQQCGDSRGLVDASRDGDGNDLGGSDRGLNNDEHRGERSRRRARRALVAGDPACAGSEKLAWI
nr:hypothetical protein CFP56_65200 [Quercus suber]